MTQENTPRPKRRLFYALFCLCLAVWGYVLYRIAHGFLAAEAPYVAARSTTEMTASSAPRPAQPGPTAPFDTSYRDPFSLPAALFAPKPAPARPTVRAGPPAPRPAPRPPPLTLTGIAGETALLEGADGSVQIVRRGERFGETRILQVGVDHVVVRYAGRSFTLKLPP